MAHSSRFHLRLFLKEFSDPPEQRLSSELWGHSISNDLQTSPGYRISRVTSQLGLRWSFRLVLSIRGEGGFKG